MGEVRQSDAVCRTPVVELAARAVVRPHLPRNLGAVLVGVKVLADVGVQPPTPSVSHHTPL